MKKPIQVYLDQRDRAHLDRLASQLGVSRAEVIREAVRRWAAEMAGGDDPVLELIGSIDDPRLPRDLSTRHDAYAVGGYPAKRIAEPPRETSS